MFHKQQLKVLKQECDMFEKQQLKSRNVTMVYLLLFLSLYVVLILNNNLS